MRSYYDVFSAAQAVTGTADSTYTLQTTGLGKLKGLYLFVKVSTTFANATSMKVTLYTGSTSSPATEVISSFTELEATLVKGYYILNCGLPSNIQDYCKLTYTVDGTHNAGAVEAWIGTAETATH